MGGRSSVRAWLANWHHSTLGFQDKARVTLHNLSLRPKRHSLCCGHPGEPGC